MLTKPGALDWAWRQLADTRTIPLGDLRSLVRPRDPHAGACLTRWAEAGASMLTVCRHSGTVRRFLIRRRAETVFTSAPRRFQASLGVTQLRAAIRWFFFGAALAGAVRCRSASSLRPAGCDQARRRLVLGGCTWAPGSR